MGQYDYLKRNHSKKYTKGMRNGRTEYLVAAYDADQTPEEYYIDLASYATNIGMRVIFDGVTFNEVYSDSLDKTFKLGLKIAELEEKYGWKDPNVK